MNIMFVFSQISLSWFLLMVKFGQRNSPDLYVPPTVKFVEEGEDVACKTVNLRTGVVLATPAPMLKSASRTVGSGKVRARGESREFEILAKFQKQKQVFENDFFFCFQILTWFLKTWECCR
ncbi:MAG: hypothetical protein Q8835_02515 [Sweet potato little leaf phytoplasma]|nr:hypothetical protein [Sweet potato little leaf phytoplasma]